MINFKTTPYYPINPIHFRIFKPIEFVWWYGCSIKYAIWNWKSVWPLNLKSLYVWIINLSQKPALLTSVWTIFAIRMTSKHSWSAKWNRCVEVGKIWHGHSLIRCYWVKSKSWRTPSFLMEFKTLIVVTRKLWPISLWLIFPSFACFSYRPSFTNYFKVVLQYKNGSVYKYNPILNRWKISKSRIDYLWK